MEQLTLKIPFGFIETTLGRPTWRDTLFGLENQLLDPDAVSDLAAAEVDQPHPPDALIELLSADAGEPILQHVEALTEREPPPPESLTTQKWLYLTLAWLFEHRDELPDPLASVETVYAEFDYPEEIAGFVRYMPADDPDLGDRKLNEDRMMGRWEHYLADERSLLREDE